MNLGLVVLAVLFIAFILILVFNPNLSCFGRRLRSPFYPLRRRRIMAARRERLVKAEDYGFRLVEEEKTAGGKASPREKKAENTSAAGSGQPGIPGKAAGMQKKPKKTEDYGFKLD